MHLFQWLRLDLATVVRFHVRKGQGKARGEALARPRPWQMFPLDFLKEAVTCSDGTQQPTVTVTAAAARVRVRSASSMHLRFEGVSVKVLATRKGVSYSQNSLWTSASRELQQTPSHVTAFVSRWIPKAGALIWTSSSFWVNSRIKLAVGFYLDLCPQRSHCSPA